MGGAVIKTPRGELWELAGAVPEGDELTIIRSTLLGIVTALKRLPRPATVEVSTDIKYIAEGFRDSLDRWAGMGWKRKASERIAHADLWQSILEERDRHRLGFIWVKFDDERRELAALAKRGRSGETIFFRRPALAASDFQGRSISAVEQVDLQRNLSYYLQQASNGHETVVTCKGVPVGVLGPYKEPDSDKVSS